MPLLTYAGLSAPKRRNDGRSSNQLAQNIDVLKPLEKKISSNSKNAAGDGTPLPLSSGGGHPSFSPRQNLTCHSKEQNGHTSSVDIKNHEQVSRGHFQLSNNTAMRLYNSSHPHRENHQRMSPRRQAPYASAPSSPWKSSYSSTSASTYLCPTMATQARQNGSFSRSQTIQRDELFGSDSSISLPSMSRSSNGGIILSNGPSKTSAKQNASFSANYEPVPSHKTRPPYSLSRSHEEQSPRDNHRILALGSSMSQKQQWMASNPNGMKMSNVVSKGSLSESPKHNQQSMSSSTRSAASMSTAVTLSSSPNFQSSQYGACEKVTYKNSTSLATKLSRNSGKLEASYDGSKPVNTAITDRRSYKRRSYGSVPPCLSSMSKSDTLAYKTVSKTLKSPGKGASTKGDDGKSVLNSASLDTERNSLPHTNSTISSSLTSSNGGSTLLSASFLSKVRKMFKKA